jgi:hypothetical protein
MSELQRQLQGRRSATPEHRLTGSALGKRHSQGDVGTPTTPLTLLSKARSDLNDILGKLSDRLKQRHDHHEHDGETKPAVRATMSSPSSSAAANSSSSRSSQEASLSSLYRCQSEPAVAFTDTDVRLSQSPSVPLLREVSNEELGARREGRIRREQAERTDTGQTGQNSQHTVVYTASLRQEEQETQLVDAHLVTVTQGNAAHDRESDDEDDDDEDDYQDEEIKDD